MRWPSEPSAVVTSSSHQPSIELIINGKVLPSKTSLLVALLKHGAVRGDDDDNDSVIWQRVNNIECARLLMFSYI
jgi:hypothetical protein